ncbi:hypothetical protein BD560DRAFT_371154, partial [Blakeslea trispora]
MSLKFFQEDGKGSVFDEYGNEPVEMEVDNEQFPLEDVTNYDTYMDLKPPERLEKMKIVKAEIVADQGHKEKEKKKVGRPKILNEEHKGFLLQKYSEDPRATVNEAMESLASQFEGLKIAKTAVHDFMVNDCALTIKKAHFEPKERNSPRSIEARFQWATNLIQTDINFMSNCVFIDESAFHISLSRTMA